MATLVTTTRSASSSERKSFITQRPVLAYLLLACGISWLLFSPGLLSTSGFGILPFDLSLKPFVLLASIAGPALPAALVTPAAEGKAGMREPMRQWIRWRVSPQWYFLALAGMPLAIIGAASVLHGAAPLQALPANWPRFFTALLPRCC